MDFRTELEVDASPEVLWEVMTDLPSWPNWTESITSAELLDAPFGPRSRVRIAQPKLQTTVYTVSRFEPGCGFDWTATAPGVTTVATHDITPIDDGRLCRLVLGLHQRGVLAPVVKLLAGHRIRHYVELETAGLKTAAEHRARQATPDSNTPPGQR